MKQRCGDKNHVNFYNYGGRGILVFPRWLNFDHFIGDMGVRPEEMVLGRKDINGNYEPENCEWMLPAHQIRRNSKRYLDKNT